KILCFSSRQPTDVHDRLRPIVGEALVGAARSITVFPGSAMQPSEKKAIAAAKLRCWGDSIMRSRARYVGVISAEERALGRQCVRPAEHGLPQNQSRPDRRARARRWVLCCLTRISWAV